MCKAVQDMIEEATNEYKKENQILIEEAQRANEEAQRANTIISKAIASMRLRGLSMLDIATQLDMSLQEIQALCAKA